MSIPDVMTPSLQASQLFSKHSLILHKQTSYVKYNTFYIASLFLANYFNFTSISRCCILYTKLKLYCYVCTRKRVGSSEGLSKFSQHIPLAKFMCTLHPVLLPQLVLWYYSGRGWCIVMHLSSPTNCTLISDLCLLIVSLILIPYAHHCFWKTTKGNDKTNQ